MSWPTLFSFKIMTHSWTSGQLFLDFNSLLKQLGKILFTGRLLMTSVPVVLIWIGRCVYTYMKPLSYLYTSFQRFQSVLALPPDFKFVLVLLHRNNFFSSPSWIYKNFPRNNQKEICFKLKFLNSGMIMQTTGRIYLTFSQLLNQVEIIDSPSAMIEMENEEVPFFFLFQPPPYHHPPCFF